MINIISDKLIQKDVTLTITEACNLNCVYCYENHKSKKVMDFETAKKIIDYELLLPDGKNRVTIDFFGGEPFLHFDLIKQVCEYVWSKEWDKEYIFFATTNGTLIHGEIAEWISKNSERFWLGLSYDGTEWMQNANRSNSAERINLPFFVSHWPKQAIKMTVSAETLPHLAEGCIALHERGFRIDCNLAYGLDWSNPEIKNMLSEQLMQLIDYYTTHLEIEPCSMLRRSIEDVLVNRDEFHKWCGAGTGMRVYSVEGTYYPCHFFQPLSVGGTKAEKSFEIDFNNADLLHDEKCKNCLLLTVCPTCYGSNYASTGDVSKRNENECELNKLTILANTYFQFKLLTMYKNEELDITIEKRKSLTDAIILIQNYLDSELANG